MSHFDTFWSRVQYILCLTAVIGVVVYLVQQGHSPTVAVSADADREVAVQVVGAKRIAVAPDSPLAQKLERHSLAVEHVAAFAARLRHVLDGPQ